MKIHIEYCIKWNYGPEFDRVSKIIKKIILENIQVIGNESPPRSGAFEISLNGKLIYSKFSTGVFPNTSDIKGWFK